MGQITRKIILAAALMLLIVAGFSTAQYSPPSAPSGPAGGDLSGTYPNPSVAKVPAINTPTPGATCSFTAPSTVCICTTTCTITAVVPAKGYQFCVFNDDNVTTAITINNPGSGTLFESTARTSYGTPGTGTFTATSGAVNSVCLYGRDTIHYFTTNSVGTWTAN